MEGSLEHSHRALPQGTVTFLLTDIEGSTGFWETDRDHMAEATARHYEIVDEAISRHGGARPREQGEGDSTVSAFTRASDALACSVDIQIAMAKENWPKKIPIRVRIGLHTGEAQLRDDGNYFGRVLSRCARLRSIAHGAQTIISRAVYDLVVDNLPEGVSLSDLGEHRLRDLVRTEHVYQVVHPDLPAEFPPLKPDGSKSNNLPAELTSFIGRETEMAQIRQGLSESRILTLTGSGGCGKTRLALHVATGLVEQYPDGTWWVDLAPINDASLVPNAVASALAIKETPGQSLAQTLTQHLRDQHAMLVLDNCEHVVEACSDLTTALTQGCEALTILATSREPLGVEGETAWRVPSLSFPDENVTEVEALPRYEAVRLFIDRAVKARPNFELNQTNAAAVAEICNRLEGLPLAIELAAARTRLLTPEQIREGLSNRFHLLAGGTRSALPRQQTLQASVDWSYNLLTNEERVLLRRLAVFAGGFSLAAAESVCSGDDLQPFQILDLLSELVDRSLIQVDELDSASRYRLLETIRQYSTQKLLDSDESNRVRNAHLDYYLAFAEATEPVLQGRNLLTALQKLDADYDNLRAAMDWAAYTNSADKVLRFASPLFIFWFVRGLFTEATTRIKSVIADEDCDPQLRAEALAVAANLSSQRFDLSTAIELGEESVTMARQANDSLTLGRSLIDLAFILSFSDIRRARALVDEGVANLREANNTFALGRGLSIQGIVGVASGELDQACRAIAEGFELHGGSNTWSAEIDLYWLGLARTFQGDLADARGIARRGIEISNELRDDQIVAYQYGTLGLIGVMTGSHQEAEFFVEEQNAIGESTNNLAAIIQSRWNRGILAYVQDDLAASMDHLQYAADMWSRLGVNWAQAMVHGWLGRVFHLKGELEEARSQGTRAVSLARECDNVFVRAFALVALARVSTAEDKQRDAEGFARESLGIFARVKSNWGIVDALEALAASVARQQSYVEAARLLAAAKAIREVFGYVPFPSETPLQQEILNLVKENLSQEEFDEVWQEGTSMSNEEAVAYASKGRGPRKRPATGWPSLTPAELDVVRLVAKGLSNPEIAKRLFISPRTVQAHLSHVFSKLAITNRAELAVQAARTLELETGW